MFVVAWYMYQRPWPGFPATPDLKTHTVTVTSSGPAFQAGYLFAVLLHFPPAWTAMAGFRNLAVSSLPAAKWDAARVEALIDAGMNVLRSRFENQN
jgi:hypothetical protein